MAFVDLVLGDPPGDSASPVDLVLGADGGASGATADVTLSSRLRLVAAVSIAPLVLGVGVAPRQAWAESPGAATREFAQPWAEQALAAVGRATLQPWQEKTTAGASVGVAQPWASAGPAQAGARQPWSGRSAEAALPVLQRWGLAGQIVVRTRERWSDAGWQILSRREPWGPAQLIIAPLDPLPPVPPGPDGPAPGLVHLHLCVPIEFDSNDLVLNANNCIGIQTGATSIQSRRSYVHTHSLQAFRLPDLTPVPLDRFELSADVGSFGWTLSASGNAAVLPLLAPAAGVPRKIRIVMDGMTWEFVVEGLRRDRSFGQQRATVTGRSVAALLGDPYAPEKAFLNTVPLTAQQIVEDALSFTGTALTWEATDWLVPAGAWSFTGTPLAAVRRVADTIGAILQCPRAGDSIIVKPRYPTLPWNWGAAVLDVSLALDPVSSEGYERTDRPDYEGVYVSGQAQGVLALVKKTGTAPALVKPLITDPLMTALEAARQRGEAELGPTGPMATMTITLPVLTGPGEPGVIDVNKLVGVSDPAGAWRGLVRSVRVASDTTVVRQTLTIERHL